METGLVLALFASFSFAVCAVVVRKASSISGEAFTAMAISVFIGLPFFAIVLLLTGHWEALGNVSWRVLLLLGAAGIIHFIIGRGLNYRALRIIGANKTTPFIMTNPIYTVFLGILFLSESLTGNLIFGLVMILGGSALVTIEKTSVATEKSGGRFSNEVKGMIAAFGGALCWGTTPVLVKAALTELGSPFAGAFVSYAVAFVIVVALLLFRGNREQLRRIHLRDVLLPISIGGVLTSGGQLLAYSSLTFAPASMLAPLMATQGVFIFILSFTINRKIEVFTFKVIVGTLATVAGTILMFQ